MKTQNQAIVKALKLARFSLEKHHEEFICLALEYSASGNRRKKNVAGWKAAQDIVCHRIRPYVNLQHWAEANIPNFPRQYHSTLPSKQLGKELRLYRLRWIDALIQEFSA